MLPRDKLMNLVEKKRPKSLANMVAATLQEIIVHNVGYKTNKTSKIKIGVTQVSLLSPILFNVYMDSIEQTLKEAQRKLGHTHGAKTENFMITLFSDDVKIQAATREGMQNVLKEASRWVTSKGI